MKKSIISILVIALLLTALAGCSSRGNDETTGTTPPADNGNVMPEDNNGVVEDGNGIIGDAGSNGDSPNEGVLPEIGNDIEQGANDVIDGVGDAIEGNDNNAASGNTNSDTNSDTSDNARGRMRTK